MKKTASLLLALITGFSLIVGTAGCTREIPELPQSSSESSSAASGSQQGSSSEPESSEPAPPPEVTVTLKAAGDNLIHDVIYQQAAIRSTLKGELGYDFYPAYERIAPLLEGADFAFLNQETLLASDVFEPSSYPLFNSPTQVGDTMIQLGFNLFSQSNNHTLDKGAQGIAATLDYWDRQQQQHDLVVAGLYRDEADMENIRVLSKNGISVALVAFTEHTNGLKLSADVPYQLIYTSELDKIQHQIEKARRLADVVIVSVHWGTENSHIVNDAQRNLAHQMANWGADIILGQHPHVLQPIEWVGEYGQTIVIYSLGNFISAQNTGNNLISGILELEIKKNLETGEIFFTDPFLTPIVTHYERNYDNLTLYPLAEYTSELAEKHWTINLGTRDFSIPWIEALLQEVMGAHCLNYSFSASAQQPVGEQSASAPQQDDIPSQSDTGPNPDEEPAP